MGPGYFPIHHLVPFDILRRDRKLRSLMSDGTVISAFAWWAVMLVIGSVVAFALLINTTGLIAAISVLVLLSAAASGKNPVSNGKRQLASSV